MKRYCILLISILLLSSCVEEYLLPAVEPGVPVTVSLSIKMPEAMSTPTSRGIAFASSDAPTKGKGFNIQIQPDSVVTDTTEALPARSAGNRKLYNLWVFQFGSDGAKRKVIKIPNTPEPIKDRVVIDAELVSGINQTIYLVALGSEYSDVDLTGVATKNELESLNLPLFKSDDAPIITNDEQMPYCGSYEGLTIAQDANGVGYLRFSDNIPFTGGIPMTAMLTRVTLDFAFNVEQATEQSIILSNIATSYPIKPSATYKPSNYNSSSITLTPDLKTADGRYRFTWYFAPNPQGKVPSITRQEERVRAANFFHPTQPGILVGNAPEDATHFVIWAKHKTESRHVLYYIYPGTNLSDDFNLLQGSSYTLRTDIDAIDSPDDLRIISAPLTQILFFRSSENKGTSNANWLQVNGDNSFGSDRYDLDAHPSRRPIEMFVLKGDVKISITNGNNWLHLSKYPNYTAAKQAQLKGDKDALTNEISVTAKIPTHYKFYIYADEYEKYIIGDHSLSTNKRRANISFELANIEGTGTNNISTYIEQRSAFLVGRMGGDFDLTTGRYSDYLAFEAIPEYYEADRNIGTIGYFYADYLPFYQKEAIIPVAEYNTDPKTWTQAQFMDYYKTDDLYNGKEATKLLSEGKEGVLWVNRLNVSTRFTEDPRWINGELDLYQYQDKYHEAHGGFVFRACFDRNRDNNGNGKIDPDEYHWYTPSFAQLHVAIGFNWRGVLSYTNQQSQFNGGISTTSGASVALGPDFVTNKMDPNIMTARCVRNVSSSASGVSASPQQPKIATVTNDIDQEKYAVIDATGLRTGNSTTNYTNYDKVNGARKADYIYGTGGVRTLRHRLNSVAGSVVSSRFMVAPTCIHTTGIDWASASGWDNAANGNSVGNTIQESGCAAYQGRNGGDTKGTWRLPNAIELILICIYQEALLTTTTDTGYQQIINAHHWTSTENNTTTAFMVQPIYKENSKKLINMTITNGFNKSRSSLLSGRGPIVIRCIKDIPLAP